MRTTMKNRFYICFACLVLLSLCGCGGSAEVERKQAQAAMEQAKTYHADNYASSDFEKAQTAWDHAQTAEKEKKTDGAKVLYTSAKIFFGKAADIARAKQETLTRELDAMRVTIGSNLDQVKNDLLTRSISAAQRKQVDTIVAEVEKDKEDINKLVDQHDLVKAVATAKSVQTKIYHAQLIQAGQKIK